ncbi:hypothetical protein ACIBP4_04775 [Micromonospora maritima]|uniref:Novel STAND NTPase 5 domain-containing protein n=1 Tax=Micromonospora maritima TaxID=986711 RepID=A0ABW7ZFG8_9ACTN
MTLNGDLVLLACSAPGSIAESVEELSRDAIEVIADLHRRGGTLDVILLLGDLTATAAPESFDALTAGLNRMWEACMESPDVTELPAVLAVPGVGDRQEQAPQLALVRALGELWTDVRDTFSAEQTDVIGLVRSAFSRFEDWYGTVRDPRWRSALLPGDGSLVVGTGASQVALVGLNSAFRMLTSGATPDMAELHPAQVQAAVPRTDGGASHPVVLVSSRAVALPAGPPGPVIGLAGRTGAGAGGGWWVPEPGPARVDLLTVHTTTGHHHLRTLDGTAVTVAPAPADESAGVDAPADQVPTPVVEPPRSDAAMEGTVDEVDRVLATGQAVLVVTSGIEDESRGEWGTPLGSPDEVFAHFMEQLPIPLVDDRVTLAATMRRLRRHDRATVDRIVSGVLVSDGSKVNETALRILRAPWYRIYDCTGTNIFQELVTRLNMGSKVVVVDAGKEVPGRSRSQLEVIAMNGIAPGGAGSPVSFDIQDRGRSGRALWFRQMKADMITNQLVVTASSVGSKHLWSYLDWFTADDVWEGGQTRLVVAPDTDQTATWKLNGSRLRQVRASLPQLARARFDPDSEELRRGAQLLARLRSGVDDVGAVQLVSSLLSTAPAGNDAYLRGADPTWGDVKDGVPAALSTFKSMLALAEAPDGQKPVLVLQDAAGTGKSTALMQLGLNLHERGQAVGWVDRSVTSDIPEIVAECAQLGLDAVLIDDIDIFGGRAAALVEQLSRRGAVLVVATVRSTRGELLDGVTGLTKVPHLRLTDEDLDGLVRHLDAWRQLGELKALKVHQARVARLRELSYRDLMAAMVEAITGFRFEDRVASEFRQLRELERSIYATICLFEALQYEDHSLTLSQNALLQIVSDSPTPAVNRAIDHLVSGLRILVKQESGHVRTRHRRVAEETEKNLRRDPALYRELVENLILFYVQRGANITNRNDPTRRAMVALINHRVMIKSALSADVVREIYRSLHDYLSEDFHYWLQCGSYEVARDLDQALNYLEVARGCEGGQDHFKVVTTWAMVCLRLARRRPDDPALHEKALRAMGELERIAGIFGEKSPHTYVSILRDGTQWLTASVLLGQDERRGLAARISHWAEVGTARLNTNREFRGVCREFTPTLKRFLADEGDVETVPI